MAYQYMMVQIPPTILIKQKAQVVNEAAYYLQSVANEQAAKGWEFFRVDTIGVVTQPGCFASMFGATRMTTDYFVVTFRRHVQNG